jgi:hypothetical protein
MNFNWSFSPSQLVMHVLFCLLQSCEYLMWFLTTLLDVRPETIVPLIQGRTRLSVLSRFQDLRHQDSRSRLVSLQFWWWKSLGFGHLCLFILQQVSGMVSSKNIGNLEYLLGSRLVLFSASRLSVSSRSRSTFDYQKSQSWTRPFVNFSRSLVLSRVAKYWSRPSLPW